MSAVHRNADSLRRIARALGIVLGGLMFALGMRWLLLGGAISMWGLTLSHRPYYFELSRSAVGAVTMLAAALAVTAFVAWKPRATIELDEGGVRWHEGARRGYTAFGSIERALVRGRFGGGMTLVLSTREDEVALALDSSTPVTALLGRILERVARAKESAQALRDDHGWLARRGRPLGEWLDDVRAATRRGLDEAYRGASVDAVALEALASDTDADVELRAAAVHALLVHPDAELGERVRARIGTDAPPLVAAVVAAGESRLEEDEAFAYLPEEDRVASRRASRRG
jgi:hypothetical protein